MLRFIKHNMTEIDGVSIYPIISLVLFLGLFLAVIYYVMRMKKSRVDELSALPFQDEQTTQETFEHE